MNAKSLLLFFVIFFSFLMNLFPVYGEDSIYEVQGKSISYEDNQNLIIATGEAYAKDQLGKEIYSDKIIYDKKKFTILTSNKSIYLDGKGNKLEANKFFYDLKLKKIKASGDVNYFTREGDHFKFSFFEYFENLQKGSGKNFVGKLADKSLLEGASAEIDGLTSIYLIKTFESGFFVKAGQTSTTVNTKEVLASGSVYKNADVDGLVLGLGMNRTTDSGFFYRVSGEYTDYDSISLTSQTADASTGTFNKISADVDTVAFKLSIGKAF